MWKQCSSHAGTLCSAPPPCSTAFRSPAVMWLSSIKQSHVGCSEWESNTLFRGKLRLSLWQRCGLWPAAGEGQHSELTGRRGWNTGVLAQFFFSDSRAEKRVCGSSLGVTVSSMQSTKATESTAIDNKQNKLTTLCVCVVLATVILAVTLADWSPKGCIKTFNYISSPVKSVS